MERRRLFNHRLYSCYLVSSLDAWHKLQCGWLNSRTRTVYSRRSRSIKDDDVRLPIRATSTKLARLFASIHKRTSSFRLVISSCQIVCRICPCDVGPNITGTFGVFQNTDKFYVDNVVFTSNTSIGRRGPQGTDDGICTNFNATGASSIYGQSSTVQPKALHLLPCIKF